MRSGGWWVALLFLGCQPGGVDGGAAEGAGSPQGGASGEAQGTGGAPGLPRGGGVAPLGGAGGAAILPTGGGGAPLGGAGGAAVLPTGGAPEPGGGEAPPPPPPCEAPPQIHASLLSPGPVTRGDPTEITFEVRPPDAALSFESSVGGHFTARADRVFWAAGGGADDPEGADFPLWSQAVALTLTASTGPDCHASVTLSQQLAGDVLLADTMRGGLLAYGSDGRYLGRAAQVLEGRGLGAILAVAGEGIVVAVGREHQQRPRVRLLDLGGGFVRDFEDTDLAGVPLWPEGPGPRQLYWEPTAREIWADNGAGGRIFRWNLDGEYLGERVVPTSDQFSPEGLGFATVQGRPVAGSAFRNQTYFVDTEPPALLLEAGDGFDTLIALATGHEDTLIALMRRGGGEWRAYRYDARLREIGMQILGLEARWWIPFLGDSYLSVDLNGVTRRGPDLAPLGDPSGHWDQRAATNIGGRGGITWLN